MTEGVCIGKRRQSVPAGKESAGMSRIRPSSGRVRPVGNKEIMAAGLLYMHEGGERVDPGSGLCDRTQGEMSSRERRLGRSGNEQTIVRVFDIVSSPGVSGSPG